MAGGYSILAAALIWFAIEPSSSMKVGIIGGGISGTSSAYFLRKAFGDELQIDLFEGNGIGGRLSTINVDGCVYETGGSVIHQKNQYASKLAAALGIKQISSQEDFDLLGIYNASDFLFIGSGNSWWNALKLMWRYGLDLIRLDRYTTDLLTKFESIYETQEKRKCFSNLDDLMYHIHPSFLEHMRVSTKAGFERAGFSDKIIDELIEATLRCNYGQTTSVHQFVGSVSVAGGGSELFALEGGNKLLPEKMLEFSRANLIEEFVETVAVKDQQFIVKTNSVANTYDAVIVSTPLTADPGRPNRIKFENFPVEISVPGKYWTTICTIVKGIINPTFFGLKSQQDLPTIIINVAPEPLFNSIGKLRPVQKCKESEVWKIFSLEALDGSVIDQIFSEVSFVETIDWLAYPTYKSSSTNVNFTLYNRLFYSNAMEWSASAIETSLIGARNVALLAEQSLRTGGDLPSDEPSSIVNDEL
ncbi:Prenylcysteine lyase [Nesidiocoris tenuis]|uniref:Prenylcysteine lyase n=1 Tax=Nesidiocoris tenuis TaxID=355587 RepID=A0ABN7AHN3_9HEMI|nr:Prenylcysteine lyase [Nesidiocoris tenuis]